MEKTKNKNLKFLTMVIVFCIGFLNTIVQFSFGQDLLEDVFLNAKSSQSIIDIWNDKRSVWREIFEEWTVVNWWLTKRCFIWNIEREDIWSEWECVNESWERKILNFTPQAPLIVRIAKFFLRMTVALAITMVIYNWIYYIVESAKGWDVTKAKTNLVYVWVWLVVSLMSLTIINLISSVSISSLNLDETQKRISFYDQFEWICKLGELNNYSYGRRGGDILEWWQEGEIKSFCLDVKQNIERTQTQMYSMLLLVVENNPAKWDYAPLDLTIEYYNEHPWDRNTTKLLQMEAYISSEN